MPPNLPTTVEPVHRGLWLDPHRKPPRKRKPVFYILSCKASQNSQGNRVYCARKKNTNSSTQAGRSQILPRKESQEIKIKKSQDGGTLAHAQRKEATTDTHDGDGDFVHGTPHTRTIYVVPNPQLTTRNNN